jgi:hypothetical protein
MKNTLQGKLPFPKDGENCPGVMEGHMEPEPQFRVSEIEISYHG